jgi:uncharacterized protein with HEPN domain
MNIKDLKIIDRILVQCLKIHDTVDKHGDFFAFNLDIDVYQTLISYYIEHIGIFITRLSDEFKVEYQDKIPFNKLVNISDQIIYEYESVDFQEVCNILKNDIPQIFAFCIEILRNHQSTPCDDDQAIPRFRY